MGIVNIFFGSSHEKIKRIFEAFFLELPALIFKLSTP
jgi:hypothetical protein